MRTTLRRWLSGLLLICCVAATAQENGNWRASSATARAITGDVMLSNEKLIINQFSTFTMVRVRPLNQSEIGAAFGGDSTGSGSLYRLDVPAAKIFLHKNSLCGSDDTKWMATRVSGRTLQIAFFSGDKPPLLTPDAIANSTDLCSTFSYVK